MTIDQMNVTKLGLLNINRKIIDSRKYKDNLISTTGAATIIDGTASSFDNESYLYKSNLSFKSGSTLSLGIDGVFLPTATPQTVWKLQGDEDFLVLQLTDSKIQLILNSTSVLSVTIPTVTDTINIRINLSIAPNNCEIVAFLNDRIHQKKALLSNEVHVKDFSEIFIGNNPSNTDTFWKGSFAIQNFTIMENNVLNYSPSTGYPISFTKILISDGEFPLYDNSTNLSDHVFKYEINEISRSGNTVLLTSQIGEDLHTTIKEIGLYAETNEGEILFSKISGLNIATVGDVPYDLVLTVNTTLSFVNVVGFPDVGSIVSKDPEFCTFKDFRTVKELTLYILTNLERLIALNATNIGYNRAQVFYRLQREIERGENCFASIQTFSKLMKRLQRIINTIFDPSSLEIYGTKESADSETYITPSISEDGKVTNFSTSDYIRSIIPFNNENSWELNTSFSVKNSNEKGTVTTLNIDSELQPLVESVATDGGRFWTNTRLSTSTVYALVHTPDYILGITYDGKYKIASEDGINWTKEKIDINKSTVYAVAYNNKDTFVALIDDKKISISKDGVHWTTPETKFPFYIYSIIYAEDQFVALSYNGYLITSKDGETWNCQPTNLSNNREHGAWNYIAYNGLIYVIMDPAGYISTSTDKITWSEPFHPEAFGNNHNFKGLTYENNQFITTCGSSSQNVFTSVNGQTWVQQASTIPTSSPYRINILFINDKYVVANDLEYIYYSTNLQTWKSFGITEPSHSSPTLNYVQNKFISLDYNRVYNSTDGINWTSYPLNSSFNNKGDWSVVFDGTKFVALSSYGYVSTSTDGITWNSPSQKSNLYSQPHWYTLIYENEKFIAINTDGYVTTSTNGTTWTDPVQDPSLTNGGWRTLVYVNGQFMSVSGNKIATSEDGETWNIKTNEDLPSSSTSGLAYTGTKYVASYPSSLSRICTSEDGETWKTYSISQRLSSLASNGTHIIASSMDGGIYISSPSFNLKIAESPALTATILSEEIEYSKDTLNTTIPNKYYTTLGNPNITTENIVSNFDEGSVNITLPTTPINSSYEEILYFTTPSQLEGTWEYPIQTSETSGFNISLKNGTSSGYITAEIIAKDMTGWSSSSRFSTVGSTTSIAYGNSIFIALNSSGSTFVSTNGLNWTESYNLESLLNSWKAITYGNNKFIALSQDGYISTSTDGTTWTTPVQNTDLGSHSWSTMTYGNGKFVAMSDTGYTSTSIDGETWTTTETPNILLPMGIAYGNEKFIAIDYNCSTYTSEDGITWTLLSNSDPYQLWQGLTYSNGEFVAIGYYGYISTSKDGITWNSATQAIVSDSSSWRDLAYGNKRFVALNSQGYSSSSISSMTSTFTNALQINTPYYFNINYTKNENNQYTVNYSYSLDGEEYNLLGSYTSTLENSPEISSLSLSGPITYSLDLNKLSLTVDDNSLVQTSTNLQGWVTEDKVEAYNLHTSDGYLISDAEISPSETTKDLTLNHNDIQTNTWSMPIRVETGELSNPSYTRITYGTDKFLALSNDGHAAISTDGISWDISSTNLAEGTWVWTTLTYGDGLFVALSGTGITTSSDGITWGSVLAPPTHNISDITSGDSIFISLSDDGTICTGTVSGSTVSWGSPTSTSLADATSVIWKFIAYGNSTFVAVGQNSSDNSVYTGTSTNGTTWTNISTRSNLGTHTYTDLIFDGTSFLLLGENGIVSTSTDGTTWENPSEQEALNTEEWQGTQLAFGNDRYVFLANTPSSKSYTLTFSSTDLGWSTPESTANLELNSTDKKLAGVSYTEGPSGYSGVYTAMQADGTFSTSFDGGIWKTGENTELTNDEWTGIASKGTLCTTLSAKGKCGSSTYDYTYISPSVSPSSSYNWKSLTYDGHKFIIVSENGYISTSYNTNNTSWTTPYKRFTDYQPILIGYGNGTYVVFNSSGQGKYSQNLTTWTDFSELDEETWTFVTYGKGKFVAIDYYGYIATSADGITWSTAQISNLGSHNWCAVIFDGSKFVAFGEDCYISTSTNGTTWTAASQNVSLQAIVDSDTIASTTFDGVQYLVLLNHGKIASSTNLTTWNELLISPDSSKIYGSLCYGNHKLLSIQYSSGGAYTGLTKFDTMPSKITITPEVDLGDHNWTSISGSSSFGKFLALSSTGYTSTSSDGETWSTPADDLGDHEWCASACKSSLAVALSSDSHVATSSDGETWSTPSQNPSLCTLSYINRAIHPSSNNSNFQRGHLAYNGTTYVAINESGLLSTSTDGTTWTTASSVSGLGSYSWYGLTCGNGLFVALGYSGYVSTSTDGETWTRNHPLDSRSWQAVTYGNNIFVALGYNGYISTSSDGITWTTPTQNADLGSHSWYSITYDDTKFIALGTSGHISTSTDGTTWTTAAQDTSLASKNWNSIAYNGSQFIAVGNNGYIALSENGTTWNTPYKESNYTYCSVIYDGDRFMILTNNGDIAIPSTDTIYSPVASVPNVSGTGYFDGVAYNGSTYIALSQNGYTSTSTDGTTWTTPVQNTDLGSHSWSTMTYGNGKFVAIGESRSVGISTDGSTWTRSETSNRDFDNYTRLTFGNRKFIALNYRTYITGISEDGINWITSKSLQNSGIGYWEALTYDGEKFIALSQYGYISTSTDGLTWTTPVAISSLQSYKWMSICYADSKLTAIGYSTGSTYSYYIATSEDGITWSSPSFFTTLNNGEYNPPSLTAGKNNSLILNNRGSVMFISPAQAPWKSLTYDGEKFIAINSDGSTATSTDGLNWTRMVTNEVLQSNTWDVITYGNNKTFVYSNEKAYSVQTNSTQWSNPEALNTQYIIGNSSEPMNESPITLSIEDEKLVMTPAMGYLYAWSSSEGAVSQIVYTTSPFPSTNDIVLSSNKQNIGKVVLSKISGAIEVYFNNEQLLETFCRDSLNDIDDTVPLVSSKSLLSNQYYNITLAYNGDKYSMEYELDPMETSTYPTSENIVFYTKIPVSFNKNSSLVFGSNKGGYKFLGNIDFANTSLWTDTYNWVGASPLTSIYTDRIFSNLTNTIYDNLTYAIKNILLVSHTGYIADEPVFEVQPNTKYYVKVQYSEESEAYIVYYSTNGRTYIKAGEYSSDKYVEDANFIYIGAEPLYNPETNEYTMVNPFEGTIYLMPWNIKELMNISYAWSSSEETFLNEIYTESGTPSVDDKVYDAKGDLLGFVVAVNSETSISVYLTSMGEDTAKTYYRYSNEDIPRYDIVWSPTSQTGTFDPQLVQYYSIPVDYNRSRFVVSDLCNFDRTLTFLDTSFTGNTDVIDFSYGGGFTLCTKVFIPDTDDKILLAKTDLLGNPYFILQLKDNDLSFTLFTQDKDVVLHKKLEMEDYASYESEPILLSVIAENDNSIYTLSFYKNNELIDQVKVGLNKFLDSSVSFLSNYLSDPNEAEIYVQDIIAIQGSITPGDLYYITNLTDTNF